MMGMGWAVGGAITDGNGVSFRGDVHALKFTVVMISILVNKLKVIELYTLNEHTP